MGIFTYFVAMIVGIIILAKLASKLRPEEERLQAEESDSEGLYITKKLTNTERCPSAEALSMLLMEKGIFTEDELFAALEAHSSKTAKKPSFC